MGTTFDVKKELSIYERVDIGNFSRLNSFMKKKSVDYQPKKSKVLHANEVQKLFMEAPDNQYLATKVILYIVQKLLKLFIGYYLQNIYKVSIHIFTITQIIVIIN